MSGFTGGWLGGFAGAWLGGGEVAPASHLSATAAIVAQASGDADLVAIAHARATMDATAMADAYMASIEHAIGVLVPLQLGATLTPLDE